MSGHFIVYYTMLYYMILYIISYIEYSDILYCRWGGAPRVGRRPRPGAADAAAQLLCLDYVSFIVFWHVSFLDRAQSFGAVLSLFLYIAGFVRPCIDYYNIIIILLLLYYIEVNKHSGWRKARPVSSRRRRPGRLRAARLRLAPAGPPLRLLGGRGSGSSSSSSSSSSRSSSRSGSGGSSSSSSSSLNMLINTNINNMNTNNSNTNDML